MTSAAFGSPLANPVANDNGRYRQYRKVAAPETIQALSNATEIPSRSFTAS